MTIYMQTDDFVNDPSSSRIRRHLSTWSHTPSSNDTQTQPCMFGFGEADDEAVANQGATHARTAHYSRASMFVR